MLGKKFGRLTVLELLCHEKSLKKWKCKCECGNTTEVHEHNLKSGGTKSCGCLRTNPNSPYKTDTTFTGLIGIWKGIKKRCMNPNYEHYHLYGGRGIKVTTEWDSFQPFYEWALNNGYQKGLQIDRINVNGNYEPSNCQWVTAKENGRNKRNNKLVTIKRETKTASEWAEIIGITPSALMGRINRGWSDEELLLPRKVKRNVRKFTGKQFTIKRETKAISEWADIAGISYASMRDRIVNDWPEEELLSLRGTVVKKSPSPNKYSGRKISFMGQMISIAELADRAGVSYATMKERIDKGWNEAELLQPKGYRRSR